MKALHLHLDVIFNNFFDFVTHLLKVMQGRGWAWHEMDCLELNKKKSFQINSFLFFGGWETLLINHILPYDLHKFI